VCLFYAIHCCCEYVAASHRVSAVCLSGAHSQCRVRTHTFTHTTQVASDRDQLIESMQDMQAHSSAVREALQKAHEATRVDLQIAQVGVGQRCFTRAKGGGSWAYVAAQQRSKLQGHPHHVCV
jgi:hypothetical protein